MSKPVIIAEPYPPPAWSETVVRGIDQHNVAVTGLPDYYPVGCFIYGASREIMAGLLADIWGGRMHVRRLWVSRTLRTKGYGATLMAHAHRYAIEKSCTHAFLRTSSYEARPFYERLGYSVYAELANHPVAPHRRYFMSLALRDALEPPAGDVGVTIVMDSYPAQAAVDVLRDGIAAHANATIGLPETQVSSHNFFLRHENGEIVGGVLANVWGDWMYAKSVWVDRPLRAKGYATRLMMAAEQHALARGCTQAFLSTFSFQARPLYERLGYRVFGELTGYPKGHSLYHLAKQLGEKA